jgi:predicted XRE-type DNA-binding protein
MLSRFGALVEQDPGDRGRPRGRYLSRRVQVRLACRKYVLHAFQKKSKSGIQTPRAEIGNQIASQASRRRTHSRAAIHPNSRRARIGEAIRARQLTQTRAAQILRIDQPKISRLLRGQLSGFSTERLMHLLTLLGRDVEIIVKPAPRSRRRGHFRVVATA